MQARARKPEYPLDFLHTNRNAYLRVAQMIGGVTVISPNPIAEVEAEVVSHAVRKLSFSIADQVHGGLTVERS